MSDREFSNERLLGAYCDTKILQIVSLWATILAIPAMGYSVFSQNNHLSTPILLGTLFTLSLYLFCAWNFERLKKLVAERGLISFDPT